MLPRRTTSFLAACLSLSPIALGCGGNVVVDEAAGGGGGDTGSTTTITTTTSSTSTTPTVVAPAIKTLRAPDRTSVRIEVTSGVNDAPTTPESYVFTSEHGPLSAKTVTWDAGAKVITLETENQKLGVEYTLVIAGGDVDGLGGKMMAADTATFWATDFETFKNFQITAERVGVGEHVVLYLVPGLYADDVDATIAEFDGSIFPIETNLFRAPPDRDDNGRTLLLGLDGQQFYGGYFDPMNSLFDIQAQNFGGHSNEMEMLYLNVAIMGGYRPDVVAHEFLHMLYQEEHPFLVEPDYFAYHNEGLAECAVHAVYGSNEDATWYYIGDPEGQLATGKSLVHWDDGNYTQYAQAYVFWTYIASQLGGVQGYADLFHSKGSPPQIDALLLEKLGQGFVDTQLHALAAAWVQSPTGPYGFQGMLTFPGPPAVVPPGTTQLPMAPFAAAFFPQSANGITAVGAGPHMKFIGLGSTGQADLDAPFDAAGGVVIALHGRTDWKNKAPEPSGTLGVQMPPGAKIIPKPSSGERDPSWLHPPPLPAGFGDSLLKWRQRTSGF